MPPGRMPIAWLGRALPGRAGRYSWRGPAAIPCRRRMAWLRRRVPPISMCAAISSTWWAARHRSKWAGTTI